MNRKYFAHVRVAAKMIIVNVKGTTSYACQGALKTSLPATIKHRKKTKLLFCHDKTVLPCFGGSVYNNQNILYGFHNTCPVDNW